MSQPFVGQIVAVGFNFAPVGWAFCNGQTLDISQYTTLYQLIGTTYGGNGVTTFNVPNLCGRVAVSLGQGPGLSNYVIGQAAGTEAVTLSMPNMPVHTHSLVGTSVAATAANPGSTVILGSSATDVDIYAAPSGNPTALASASIGSSGGGSQPHENRQPFLTINYIIALSGIYPSQQ
jgi:microcystin-dependent protein